MIKAPYNFVPVSDKVYFPDWASKISHDIPFSDGLSGSFEISIKAETPIFVRNGHVENDKNELNDVYNSFSNVNKKYFIPGTTLKGCIRNVHEILSFSKLRLNKNAKFAQREWGNNVLYPLKTQQQNFYCGWLSEVEEGFQIVDCGKPYRIGHSRIDEWLGQDLFRKHFSKETPGKLNEDHKTAEFKYKIAGDRNLYNLHFTIDEVFANQNQPRRIKYSTNGEIKGDIVFTGQPDKWMWERPKTLTPGAGKFYEFVFPVVESNNVYKLSEDDVNHFKFIYSESDSWVRIKKSLASEKGVPVFFRKKGNQIIDFGMAYLYKLPYLNSAYETLSSEHKNNSELDLTECVFGTENSNDALKGRVQFGNAFCVEGGMLNDELIFTLGSPKASYYPTYIEQKNGSNGIVSKYSTYNDSKIRGWKKYPIRDSVFGNKSEFNKDLDTKMTPLKKGSIFNSTVRFHNLRPIELASLYSALTLHNSNEGFHQLGQGKPFGLGKVKIQIKKLKVDQKFDIERSLALFESDMKKTIKSDWNSHQSIIEFFTLSNIPVGAAENELFSYMFLSTNQTENDFIKAKKINEYLKSFSEIKRKTYMPKSYLSAYEEEQKANAEIDAELQRQNQAKIDEQAAELMIKEIEDIRIASNMISLSEKVSNINKLPTLFGSLKTWMKLNNVNKLSDENIEVLKLKSKEIFVSCKTVDKRQWSEFNKWKELSVLLGENLSVEIFQFATLE